MRVVGRDVRRIAQLLEEEHVEYALIGGYALALQGIVRLTEDARPAGPRRPIGAPLLDAPIPAR
ncbi:MAG TPA: hypothetical protein VGL81_18030 [Polyangiaceae bacterium]|jgi:hypothetical protein